MAVVGGEAGDEGLGALAQEAAVGLEDAEGVAGVEDVVGFVAEALAHEEEVEAGGRGEVVCGVEVYGTCVGAEEVGEDFGAEFRGQIEESERAVLDSRR